MLVTELDFWLFILTKNRNIDKKNIRENSQFCPQQDRDVININVQMTGRTW
jgi:hypothetical protein